MPQKLSAEKIIDIRFSEVDAMNIVWHGRYAAYFEDARETFGKKYGLEYLYIYENGYFTPIVELHFSYKRPLQYQHQARIVITYRPTEAAKLIFDYEIYDLKTNELAATGYSVQVFVNLEHQLSLTAPDFFVEWNRKNNML